MWINFCVVCLVLSLGAQATAQPTVWDFENDSGNWKPRAATMKVERAAGLGATTSSHACLHVLGSMEENWNYVLSDSVPMQAGRLYRLSAWVKVASAGSTTPAPFLKCEFVAAERQREMGRASTDPYNVEHLGQWQRLTAEFHAPAGTVSCWLALEKGTSDPTQIDAYLDDVTLEPIETTDGFVPVRPRPAARRVGEGSRHASSSVSHGRSASRSFARPFERLTPAFGPRCRCWRTGRSSAAPRRTEEVTPRAAMSNCGNGKLAIPCPIWPWRI